MKSNKPKIFIIGAGVSGLISAKVLEDAGHSPTILEATDRCGGRVKTDVVSGYQLDVGFQVLLSNYAYAKKYLDFDKLKLQELKAGSILFKNKRPRTFGDPLRDVSLLSPTLFSGIGTLIDKIKIAKLSFQLKKKSVQDIFTTKEQTTLSYLKDFGFSKQIISDFFLPFFTGIFLETELKTSSRMFEYVFKMFAEGMAYIPENGIEAIPLQLASNLKTTSIKFNTSVKSVNDLHIILENGEQLEYDYVIIATEPGKLVHNLKNQEFDWNSSQTLYFTAKQRTIQQPIIGLVTSKDSLVNNIFYHTSVKMNSRKKEELLSATVVKPHELTENELVEQIKEELKTNCNIEKLTFLKLYNIPKSLPALYNLQNDISPTETKLNDRIYLAGDTLLNASLNAAMVSGEKAAMGLIEGLQKKKTQRED